jgi:phosphatidylinositol-bisphosphatase
VKVILGDLNYRVLLDGTLTRKYIASKDYEHLHKYDEFKQYQQKENEILRDFQEGPLYFDPTYKYLFNSNEYQPTSSSKPSIPAWCDRILFEVAKEGGEDNLNEVLYNRAELRLSGHRPVFGLFEAKIRKINEDKMAELEEKLIQEFNLTKKEEEKKS